MYLTGERDEMVFAHGKDLDVLNDHHFVMVLGEDGVVDDDTQVVLVALREVEHGFGIAGWSVKETFARGVLADTF